MTLAEIHAAMRDEHLPPNMCWFIDHWEQANGMSIDDYHAESIICWEMVKAIRPAMEDRLDLWWDVENIEYLSAAYFAAFPKEVK